MSKIEKITLGIATLALVIALSVAMFGRGKITTIIEKGLNLSGVTNFDIIDVDEAVIRDTAEGWISGSIAEGSTYSCEQLVSPVEGGAARTSAVWIYEADMGIPFGAVASSSYTMTLFATSSSSVPPGYDFTTTNQESASTTIIARTVYATGTTATTTSLWSLAMENIGVNLNRPVMAFATDYVCAFVQINTTQSGAGRNTTEPATSTNAFSSSNQPFYHIKYHR